jgi:hypothetical protein
LGELALILLTKPDDEDDAANELDIAGPSKALESADVGWMLLSFLHENKMSDAKTNRIVSLSAFMIV